MSSVSCASAGNCTVAGGLVLATETAGSWAAGVEAPLPGDAAANPQVGLGSVSCSSAGLTKPAEELWRTQSVTVRVWTSEEVVDRPFEVYERLPEDMAARTG